MIRTPDSTEAPVNPEWFAGRMQEQRPLLIRDCFRGHKIAELARMPPRDAFSETVRLLGDMPLPVIEEYTAHLLRSPREFTPTVPMGHRTLSQYFDYIQRNPYSRRMYSEVPPPAPILDLFAVPDYCEPRGEWVSKLFIGNSGNHAHMHYDFDFRHVLFYQAIGRKRIVIIPVAETWKLMPVLNFSSYFLENLRPSDQRELLDFANAYDVMLEPGDALYMPVLCWHYLEYTDTGMSIAIRFGRCAENKRIKEALPGHTTSEMQIVGSQVARDPARWAADVERIIATASRHYSTGVEKFQAVQEVLRALAARMQPESFVRHFWRGHAEVIEEGHIAGSYEKIRAAA